MEPIFDWSKANFWQKLQRMVQVHTLIPPGPLPPSPTDAEEAQTVCQDLLETMWGRARSGARGIRYERFLVADDTTVARKVISARLEAEGFVFRNNKTCHIPNPVIGSGCYYINDWPTVEDNQPRMALLVEAGWQVKGWCLACGQQHMENSDGK